MMNFEDYTYWVLHTLECMNDPDLNDVHTFEATFDLDRLLASYHAIQLIWDNEANIDTIYGSDHSDDRRQRTADILAELWENSKHTVTRRGERVSKQYETDTLITYALNRMMGG